MAEGGDGRLARRQAMLREQFGNGTRYDARRCLNSAMTSFAGSKSPELLWTERRKFRDRLPDCCWIKWVIGWLFWMRTGK